MPEKIKMIESGTRLVDEEEQWVGSALLDKIQQCKDSGGIPIDLRRTLSPS